MSIINTGINIVSTGVNKASSQLKTFGRTIQTINRDVQTFATGYDRSINGIRKSSTSLSSALGTNWENMYRQARSSTRNQEKQLQALETAYDRTFRTIGNKYQSMVMGSVALSMSGIGIKNKGMALLGGLGDTLNQARDFETVMRQIQFYGKKTNQQMDQIRKNIFKMGLQVPVSTTQIANSVLEAQKTGYSNTSDASKMGLEASKIQFMSQGKIAGDEALKYASQMTRTFGYSVDKASKLTDKLAMTADVSSASIDSLWKTFQSSRTAYNSLQTDPNTFLTLTGVMADRLTPRQAGMALSSFGGGVQMAEKAGRENKGSRGKYYNELTKNMGGNFDSYKGDILKYIQDVFSSATKLWGTGSQRTGNLQSVFGKSAMDLFYAYDQFSKQTGRSMTQMRQEISKADGHAQKLINTLMNGSYGTEQRLKTLVEQFKILFGTAIRPAFNKILDVLNGVLTKVNKFIQEHPKLAKALGYGVGLAGLFLTVTGASMLFVGGLLAIYASLNNVIIQIARNTKAIELLEAGYRTTGEMVKAQMLGPLKLLGVSMLKLGGISFFLYMAWKHDFLRLRTTLTDWWKYVQDGFAKGKKMFALYGHGTVSQFDQALKQSEKKNSVSDIIGRKIAKVQMAWDALRTMFKNHGILSKDQYTKLKDAGLLPFIEKVYDVGTAIQDFWKGFINGVKGGLEILKPILTPLVNAFKWLYNMAVKLGQHFGYFKNESNGISSKWEQMGVNVGRIVGMVLAIRIGLTAWTKALKLGLSPIKLMLKTFTKIKDIFTFMKGFKFNPLAMATKMLVPKSIRNVAKGYSRRAQARTMQGAYSNIPNASIDPVTGQYVLDEPTNWRERRDLRRARRNAPVLRTDNSGASSTLRRRGIRGRLSDFWNGEQYVPDVNVDSRGRTYRSIRTSDGRYTRTTAEGRVNGQLLRRGGFRNGRVMRMVGRGRTMGTIANMINFADAGMDYASSVGTKGHFFRSLKAGAKGFINRSRRSGITAGGNSLLSRVMGEMGHGGGGGLAKSLGKIFTKIPWGEFAKIGGKGFLKGLGFLLKRGLPLIFKIGLRAIPFLGEALMAWDIIRTVFTNWGAIKKAAHVAWNWIKTDGVKYLGMFWNWIKSSGHALWNWYWGMVKKIWNGIKSWAVKKIQEAWSHIKSSASSTWSSIKASISKSLSNMFQPIKNAWNSAKKYISNNPIVQTIKKVTKTVSQSKWNPLNWLPGHKTGLWNVPKDNYVARLHQGEMVLTNREAQVVRSMVGSKNNSIAEVLLGQSSSTAKARQIRSRISGVGSGESGGSATVHTEINFKENSVNIQIADASPSEIKKGAKKMFEEFKRMVEIDNMKNYRPARPKRPRPV